MKRKNHFYNDNAIEIELCLCSNEMQQSDSKVPGIGQGSTGHAITREVSKNLKNFASCCKAFSSPHGQNQFPLGQVRIEILMNT